MDSFKAGIELLLAVIPALKGIIDKLPNSSEKTIAAQNLEHAEQQFRIAEAKAAKGLGYPLCRCTFPPQVMLLTEQAGEHYRCPKCNREEDMTRRLPSVNATARGRLITPWPPEKP
jgi:hypothetical protein